MNYQDDKVKYVGRFKISGLYKTGTLICPVFFSTLPANMINPFPITGELIHT